MILDYHELITDSGLLNRDNNLAQRHKRWRFKHITVKTTLFLLYFVWFTYFGMIMKQFLNSNYKTNLFFIIQKSVARGRSKTTWTRFLTFLTPPFLDGQLYLRYTKLLLIRLLHDLFCDRSANLELVAAIVILILIPYGQFNPNTT